MDIKKLKEMFQKRLEDKTDLFTEDFMFGVYQENPNTKGCFQENDSWFIYEIDDKKIVSISGPFYRDDIIVAIAMIMHCTKYFDEYKISEDGLKKYIHNHFRTHKEAIDSVKETDNDKITDD